MMATELHKIRTPIAIDSAGSIQFKPVCEITQPPETTRLAAE